MKIGWALTALICVLGFALLTGRGLSDMPLSTLPGPNNSLEVYYVANEGYLIIGGGKKVLIDALFRDGIHPYLKPSADNRAKLESAASPFDQVDLLLATHYHADHFDPSSVAAHLTNNNRALFISTGQAVDKMKSSYDKFDLLKGRVVVAQPKEGERVRFVHNGINVHMLNITHGRSRPVENLGFLVELAGKKILHIGDSEATADDFARNNLKKEQIDIAFLPFWYFLGASEKRALQEQIAPKQIVLMHIPSLSERDEWIEKRGGWTKVLAGIKSEFPNAVIFEKEMGRKVFN